MYQYTVQDAKRIRVIVDTDAACEADDPFAIVHALLSPKLLVKAIVAAHFAQPGSMERSLDVIRAIASLIPTEVPLLHGQPEPLRDDDSVSEGVAAIIAEARSADSHPLWVLCLGAVTDVARAIQLAPDILPRLKVVAIGGQSYHLPYAGFREFNFGNDIQAANTLLGSGAGVLQVPCDAYATMRVGLAELQRRVLPCGTLGKYLFEQMVRYNESEGAFWTAGESWSLGDNPAVGIALHPGCGLWKKQPARKVNEDTTYADEPLGTEITVYQSVDSRYVLEDLFAKIEIWHQKQEQP